MLAGPVFEFELLTTARRGRYYLTRAAYAGLLLYAFYLIYLGWVATYGEVLSPVLIARFALATFGWLAVLQLGLVLTLTPALTAGVIASEKQSKTLHYVMATPLSGVEVVLGKLLSRLLHVGVFLGVGFPVLSMLVLLGGVDPWLVLLACGAAASSAFVLAAAAVLASVYARRVREALFLSYALEFLWLVGPELFRRYAARLGAVGDLLTPLNEWLLASDPFSVGREMLFGFLSGGTFLASDLVWLIGLQSAAAAALVALAAWRLRPVFRKQEGGGRVSSRPARAGRPRKRPEIGDDPMGWKERHASRGTVLTRTVGLLAALAVVVPIVYELCLLAPDAFLEFWAFGHGPMTGGNSYARIQLCWFLRPALGSLTVPAVVLVAGAAAASVSSEHEADTWISLTATDLSGREILRSKLRASIRPARGVLVVMAFLVAVGLACGSVHPLSVPVVAAGVAVDVVFAGAFGVWVSLQLRSTWRAQFMALAGLLLINVAGQTVLGLIQSYPSYLWPGFMPVSVATAVFAPDFPARFVEASRAASFSRFSLDDVIWNPFWTLVLDVLSVIFYGSFTVVLAAASRARFERVAGRAVRPRSRTGGDAERPAIPTPVETGVA